MQYCGRHHDKVPQSVERIGTGLRATVAAMAVCLLAPNTGVAMNPVPEGKSLEGTRLVLVGASIGKAWDFPRLGERTGLKGYRFEYLGVPDTYDKSVAIDELRRRKGKPHAVLIKECSTFFPGDIEAYKSQMRRWVAELKADHMRPVLATVAPSARPSGVMPEIKSAIKSLLGRPNRFDQITAYNAWIREYAQSEKLPLLDLERELRISEGQPYLDSRYDIGDQVHLNQEAYKRLDKAVLMMLKELQ